MKTVFTLLTVLCLCANLQAQYCGYYGANVCIPTNIDTSIVGFQPVDTNSAYYTLPEAIKGTPYQSTISFYLGTAKVTFQGNDYWIDISSFTILSIDSLPDGMCWTLNNNHAKHGDTVCITFIGTTCTTAAVYYPHMVYYVGFPEPQTTNFIDRFFKLQVTDNNIQPCVQTVVNAIENYTANAKFEIANNTISISGIEEPGLITVTDLMGRLLCSSQYTANTTNTINATNLSGLLLVNFNGAHGGVTKRIFK